MVSPVLSNRAQRLTEATSIALVQQIQQQAIATPLLPAPIPTTYVHSGGSCQPPVLLLHGFDSSVMEFRRLLPLLADHHDVWAIDLLGFGFTHRPPGLPISPAAIQQHLYATWQTLIQRPVVLVGASMGGAAAIDFTLAYPEAVASLVLLDSAGFSDGPTGIPTPLAYLGAEVLRNPWVRDRISKAAYCDPRWASADAATCAALHLDCPGWRRAMASFTQSGGYRGLAARIATLTPPTLVIWGRDDRILGVEDARRFDQALQDRTSYHRLLWIDRCGHVPHLEQPQATAQAIHQWIKSQAAIAPAPR
jgi:pimeloyl-ACP methyl ester carboxylesterase